MPFHKNAIGGQFTLVVNRTTVYSRTALPIVRHRAEQEATCSSGEMDVSAGWIQVLKDNREYLLVGNIFQNCSRKLHFLSLSAGDIPREGK